MTQYFDRDESIYNRVGDNIPRVLEIIANRYIGQHPPLPFVFRAFSRRGFLQLNDGRYDLNLQSKYPEAKPGQWAYLYGMLWSDDEMSGDLLISAYSPTSVFVNGKLIYRALLAHETNVQASKLVNAQAHKGWNAFFIKTCKTPAGFGCIIGTSHKRAFPLHFMSPLAERVGQAGWIYSQLVNQDVYSENKFPVIGDSEQATGLAWFPQMSWDAASLRQKACARIFGVQPGKIAYGWSQIEITAPTKLQIVTAGATKIWIDGKQVWEGQAGESALDLALSHGRHDVFVATVSASDDWGFVISGAEFRQPYPVKGCDDAWLYLGPFDAPLPLSPTEIQTLYRLFDNNGTPVYWRVDMPETWVRPHLENENFGKWNYQIGVTLYGLLQTGRLLGRKDVIDYVVRHVGECVKTYPYSLYDRDQYGTQSINHQLVEMSCLDDCGSFGAATLETYKESPSPEIRVVVDAIADYILNKQVRTPDGAFYRVHTMWIDDLYMSTPFLGRYYKLTGKREYIDDAARQFLLYKKYLFLPQHKIMSHIYDFEYDMPTGIPWGRGNGWCLFSLSEILEMLPGDHPLRPALLEFFSELCEGYLALQGERGLWHQVLTDPEAYEETSCTAMFSYAFARGVRFGWLKEPARYVRAVYKAWRGLTQTSVDRLGNVHGVCRGSNYAFTPDYYKYELLWRTNDTHGIGIVMLAGGEILKLDEWLASR
jgi:rhamnogalacturonyl hydrolase YesR